MKWTLRFPYFLIKIHVPTSLVLIYILKGHGYSVIVWFRRGHCVIIQLWKDYFIQPKLVSRYTSSKSDVTLFPTFNWSCLCTIKRMLLDFPFSLLLVELFKCQYILFHGEQYSLSDSKNKHLSKNYSLNPTSPLCARKKKKFYSYYRICFLAHVVEVAK